jgi:hypothetical protein
MKRGGSGRGFARAGAFGAALALLMPVGCGDDTGSDGNQAGSGMGGAAVSAGATSGGTTATAGSASAGKAGSGASGTSTAGGSSANGDLSSLCMTVCTSYDQACPADGLHDCAALCQPIVTGPAACGGLQQDYLTCLSTRKPNCGANDWGSGYEAPCGAKGRGVCLLTKGAECIAGQAYDDTLCQAFAEGNFGYYCQQSVVAKPGCKFSQNSTREGLYCCENKLTL